MSYRLSGPRVNEVFLGCMAEDVSGPGVTVINGITAKYAMDSKKIEAAKPEIAQMLLQLDDTFMIGDGKGGGWSLLNACVDRDGQQWTGLHRSVEELFVLGIAASMGEYTMDRDLWSILPGGVPYYSVREHEARRYAGKVVSG